MKNNTKTIVRAGIIAGLYVCLTLIFMPIAFGPLQIRPSESLTVLPVFFIESIPALFIGCAISNIGSAFGILDVIIGSLVTLISAILTRILFKKLNNVYIALIPPVILNSFIIPLVYYILGMETAYFINVLSIFLCEFVFAYIGGILVYVAIKNQQKKGVNLLK